ncbi:MAG TPA: two-component regulator propeller domain-containing protein [Bacteroidota bacterium]
MAELYQDSHGYLFVSSAEGLSIFDGASFTHYRTKDGLPSNFVNCVVEQPGPQGVMWIGTNNGLAKFRSNRFTQMLVDTTQRSLLVRSIFVDVTGTVWCGTLGGLYTIRGDSISKMELGINYVSEIKVAGLSPDSVVWVAVGNALLALRLSGEVIRRIPLSNSKTNHFTDVLTDRHGNVWVGLRDSTLRLFRKGLLVAKRRIPTGRVHHLMVDEAGDLHIGTDDGLLIIDVNRFHADDFEQVTTRNGLPSNFVNGGLIDKEKNLWLSFRDMGIATLKTRGVWTFPLPGIPTAYNNARAVCDSAGHFWVLSGDSLVEMQRVGRSNWLVTKHGLGTTSKTGQPIGVVYDHEHRLWLSFREARIHVYQVRSQRGKASALSLIKTLETGIPHFYFTFTIDRRDRLWCQQKDGVVMIDHKRNTVMRTYTPADGIDHVDTRTMYEDREGKMWLGQFTNGIVVVHGDGTDSPLRTFAVGRDLPAGFIRALCEDNDGRMWVGTRYSGCAVLDGDSVHQLSAENVLPSDAVWCIAKDGQGIMWLGTSLGLVAIDPVTRRPIPTGNDIVRDPVLALGVSQRNEIWFVTSDAFGIIERNSLHEPPQAPVVRVDLMKVDEQLVDLAGSLELPHDHNNCTFGFLSVSFRSTQDIRYQYRLLGLDDDWQQPTSQRSVTYASLKPGGYRFEVRGTRIGTSSYSPPAVVSFTITPPFWGTWWFMSLSFLGVAGTLLLLYQRRISSLEKEKRTQQEFSVRLMESQENERKRIAGELHDSLVQNLLVAKNRSLLGMKKAGDAEGVTRELSEISDALSEAIDEVREIAHNLRPYHLDRLGLSKALRALVERMRESSTIEFRETIDPIDSSLSPEDSIQLFRIIQEAMNNILKHSGATLATVSVGQNGQAIDVVVSDNGKGFIAHSAAKDDDKPATFGLGGIEQRVGMMNGTWSIQSSPGSGTTVNIRIPVKGQPQ